VAQLQLLPQAHLSPQLQDLPHWQADFAFLFWWLQDFVMALSLGCR
jgi:hypothetical protein